VRVGGEVPSGDPHSTPLTTARLRPILFSPPHPPELNTMETITLNNGVDMPALGLGVFQTPPRRTVAREDRSMSRVSWNFGDDPW